MPTSPYLVSLLVTQATGGQPSRLELVADQGDSIGPLTLKIPGLFDGIEAMEGGGPRQYRYVRLNVPGGTYAAQVLDASPAQLPGFTTEPFTFTDPPVNVVKGCTDPDADNYDPAATDEDGSCAYTQRLLAADLPELAPLGVPLLTSLSSQHAAGALVGTGATVLIDLTALGSQAGAQLRVDGYLLTSGPLIAPRRFVDAPTLLAALQALPVLAAAYVFTQPMPGQVLITARAVGVPGAPTVSTTSAAIALTATAGVAELYSQRRYAWGCYVEVWAGCGTLFGGAVDKSTAVLAQRLTLPYRADNAYLFDVATALRGFTGHAYPLPDGSCPDRLVSYFLRFGEEYADAPTGLRRVRSTYETPVAWGLEAMVVPAPIDGVRLLSSRPGAWAVVPGRRAVVGLLASDPAPLGVVARLRLATSRTTQDVALGELASPQAVTGAVPAWLLPPGALSGELRLADDTGAVGEPLASFEAQAQGAGLTFVNREGSADTFFFAGTNEETDKRTGASFSNASGPVDLSAEFQAGTKLYTGLIDLPTWDWLRQQLGTTPAVWLETEAGPLRVRLADVATESDSLKGEYSLAVTLNPPPLRGLSS